MSVNEKQLLMSVILNMKTLLSQRIDKMSPDDDNVILATSNIKITPANTRGQYVTVNYTPKGKYTPKSIDIGFGVNNKARVHISVYEDNELIFINDITEVFNNTGTGYYWHVYGKLREIDLSASARIDLAVFLTDNIIEASSFYNEYSVLPVLDELYQ